MLGFSIFFIIIKNIYETYLLHIYVENTCLSLSKVVYFFKVPVISPVNNAVARLLMCKSSSFKVKIIFAKFYKTNTKKKKNKNNHFY